MGKYNPFDRYHAEYDRWFDSPEGSEFFRLELDCLKPIVNTHGLRWLEIGCGSGRFSAALGVTDGVDLSPAMVDISLTRGINAVVADGGNLPYPGNSFDGVLLLCTICFLETPVNVLLEASRVMKDRGRLLVGFIPADSRWGRCHSQKGRHGHRFYSHAHFYVQEEIKELVIPAGFAYKSSHKCQLPRPDGNPAKAEAANDGFIVLTFVKGA